jgi:hypothetical protein
MIIREFAFPHFLISLAHKILITEVDKLTAKLAIAMENTKLPKYPDQKLIEEKQMEIIKAYLSL